MLFGGDAVIPNKTLYEISDTVCSLGDGLGALLLRATGCTAQGVIISIRLKFAIHSCP